MDDLKKYKEELDKVRDNNDSVVVSARSYSKMINDLINFEQRLAYAEIALSRYKEIIDQYGQFTAKEYFARKGGG